MASPTRLSPVHGAREVPRRSIIGVDYYEWNERLIDSDGQPRALGELFGWYVIATNINDRYKRPMMHTETNRMDASDGPRWLWRQWHNVQLLRSAGVPLVGFTWYSLTDQIDWDIGLARRSAMSIRSDLFDLNRDIRAVGIAYRRLIEMHQDQPGYATVRRLQGAPCIMRRLPRRSRIRSRADASGRFSAGAIAGMVATPRPSLCCTCFGSLARRSAHSGLAGDRDHRRRMPRDGGSGSALCPPAGPGGE